jgi:hypothetical protein
MKSRYHKFQLAIKHCQRQEEIDDGKREVTKRERVRLIRNRGAKVRRKGEVEDEEENLKGDNDPHTLLPGVRGEVDEEKEECDKLCT